jgi:hypothetical protein
VTGNLDDLLHSAGEHWRSTQPPPPQPDTDRWHGPARPAQPAQPVRSDLPVRSAQPARRRWAPVLAATVVAVAASVLAVQTRDGGTEDLARRTTGDVSLAMAWSPADQVVRDGMRVRASGTVLAVPGQPVRFCAPAITPAWAGPDENGTPRCPHWVVVTGVDLDTLVDRAERAGTRFGTASLTGTWQSGVLAVTDQGPPAPPAMYRSPPIPCPAPAGGWKATGYIDNKALFAYVNGHDDRFRRPWVGYVDGGVEVLVVEVVRGDVGADRDELRRRYPGNLCVVSSPGRWSVADEAANLDRVAPAVTELMRNPANGVYLLGGDGDRIIVEMVMLTPELYDRLAAIGLAAVDLNPWLRVVR